MLLIMTIMNTITARGSIPIINRYSAARRAASPHAGIACLDCVAIIIALLSLPLWKTVIGSQLLTLVLPCVERVSTLLGRSMVIEGRVTGRAKVHCT